VSEFRQGSVQTAAYEALLRSPVFGGFERDVAEFLRINEKLLEPYARRWVRDPLHQWSRAWEYPFAEHWLRRHLEGRPGPAQVLDAGSGITFFPYLLAATHPHVHVHCLDQDRYLAELFAGIRHPAAGRVRFSAASLQGTGLPAQGYDAIYCISVLEHTRNYPEILDEFRRLLKPGGRLVITVDISLDGRSDIPLPGLRDLLENIGTRFRALDPAAVEALVRLEGDRAGGIVTTEYVRRTRSHWLPWRFPRLSGALASLKQTGVPRFAVKQLTFACLVYELP
jgi:SAM-dependent methyltransferase